MTNITAEDAANSTGIRAEDEFIYFRMSCIAALVGNFSH